MKSESPAFRYTVLLPLSVLLSCMLPKGSRAEEAKARPDSAFEDHSDRSRSALPDLRQFGAVCDGRQDDSQAILTAGRSGHLVIVPVGTICFAKKIKSDQLQGHFMGGQIRTSDGQLHGPIFGTVISPVRQAADPTSFSGWADGDMQFPLSAEEFHIRGIDTAGKPRSGYFYMQGVDPHYAYFDTDSGWNESKNSNDGRTGQSWLQLTMQHNGQGDMTAYTSEILCNGQPKPQATSWLANPACAVENGDVSALKDGQFLQKEEFHINGNDHVVAAVGRVTGYVRSQIAHPRNEMWVDSRSDCRPEACDAWASLTGKWHIGLDLLGPSTTIDASIASSADQRLYLNGRNRDVNANPVNADLGGDWIAFSTQSQSIQLNDKARPVAEFYNQEHSVSHLVVHGATLDQSVFVSSARDDIGVSHLHLQSAERSKVYVDDADDNIAVFDGTTMGAVHLQIGRAAGGKDLSVRAEGNANADLTLSAAREGNVVVESPVIFPRLSYSRLPAGRSAGRQMFCSDCRKPGEPHGAGTGMMVFDDGRGQWWTLGGIVALD